MLEVLKDLFRLNEAALACVCVCTWINAARHHLMVADGEIELLSSLEGLHGFIDQRKSKVERAEIPQAECFGPSHGGVLDDVENSWCKGSWARKMPLQAL
jgi:hypothetical protein